MAYIGTVHPWGFYKIHLILIEVKGEEFQIWEN